VLALVDQDSNEVPVLYEERDGIAWITLNRPEKLNAIREQTAAEIMHAMEEVEMDRSIVAVILQGSEKAFCTGTDTSGFQYSPGSLFDAGARAKPE
jgi:enoyl-CoA hydratase/carnithine racemase